MNDQKKTRAPRQMSVEQIYKQATGLALAEKLQLQKDLSGLISDEKTKLEKQLEMIKGSGA